MNNLKSQFEQLASRGVQRDAGAVIESALEDAMHRRAASSAPGEQVAVVRPQLRSHRLRQRRGVAASLSFFSTTLAFIGITSSVIVATFALSSVDGDGGFDSPQAAVQALATALDKEDVFAAVATFDPLELPEFTSELQSAATKAEKLKIVRDAADPFAALDISLSIDDLSATPMAPQVSAVTVQLRDVEINGVPDQLGQAIRDNGGKVEQRRISSPSTTLVAIQREGSWYLSVTRTALAQLQANIQTPAPDFAATAPAGVALGAATPAEAAERVSRAFVEGDITEFAAMLDPATVPAWEYLSLLQRMAVDEIWGDDQSTRKITGTTSKVVSQDGERALVNVDTTFDHYKGQQRPGHFEMKNNCLRRASLKDGVSSSEANQDGLPSGTFASVSNGYISAFCTSYWMNTVIGNYDPINTFDAPLGFVQRDGAWFLSPGSSLIRMMHEVVSGYDEQHLTNSIQGTTFYGDEIRGEDGTTRYQRLLPYAEDGVLTSDSPFQTGEHGTPPEEIRKALTYGEVGFEGIFVVHAQLEPGADSLVLTATASDGVDVTAVVLANSLFLHDPEGGRSIRIQSPDTTEICENGFNTETSIITSGPDQAFNEAQDAASPPDLVDVVIIIPDLGDGPLTLTIAPIDQTLERTPCESN